ncbi:hypothetical protein AB0M36_33385 [Actinoplanes sp. NPDC051346]|uniref:hypothetical protein n=1 Tax=Actinoplanes sp. NPDC051346 TaxID=3155048 RepID=UPI003429108C
MIVPPCCCVGSLRNTRRGGGTLLEQAEAANQALLGDAPGGFALATGLLGRLDLRTGILALVSRTRARPLMSATRNDTHKAPSEAPMLRVTAMADDPQTP